jgi:eukaryotic-like serine/threonine-protein kinase
MNQAMRRCPKCDKKYGKDTLFCPTDGSPLVPHDQDIDTSDDPFLGLKILDQIELKQLIGVGSMARVYRAYQVGVERDVAVKILHENHMGNPEIVERFQREARISSQISHPNVVHVLLTTQLPDTAPAGGSWVLITEFLDGMSLQSALEASGGALTLPRALHVILQVCNALAEAHALQIVHRDLKPENIMLVQRGSDPDFVKVLDFGLARTSHQAAAPTTRAGAIFGSPHYMSPEGAQGMPVGPSADVYSIATIFYQCLSGKTPFEADTAVALLVAQASDEPPRLTSHERASYVPEPIVELIHQNLAKEPELRCKNAAEFREGLVEAAIRAGLFSNKDPNHSQYRVGSLEASRAMELSADLKNRLDTPGPGHTLLADEDDLMVEAQSHLHPPTIIQEPDEIQEVDEEELVEKRGPNQTRVLEPSTSTPVPVSVHNRQSTSPESVQQPAVPPPFPSSDTPPLSGIPLSAPIPNVVAKDQESAGPRSRVTAAPHSGVVPSPPPSRPMSPSSGGNGVPAAALPTPAPQETGFWRNGAPSWTSAILIALCFAGGATLAGIAAVQMGVIGSGQHKLSKADTLLTEIKEKIEQDQWDAQPNIEDLFIRADLEFPQDQRFKHLRQQASLKAMEVSARAREKSDDKKALSFAQLALRLNATNILAKNAIRTLEAASASVATVDPLPPPVPSAAIPIPMPTESASSVVSSAPPKKPPPAAKKSAANVGVKNKNTNVGDPSGNRGTPPKSGGTDPGNPPSGAAGGWL